ncbi:MAG: hypothetical protein JW816_01050 [Candidatus Buchananbacteria bacterium]|nr:hypothetical protein [Candidatus Buchananbacteria bacterium]
MFGKKKKNIKSNQPPLAVDFDANVAAQVHVMPQRFYQTVEKKKIHWLVIIPIVLVVVIGLSVGVYFLFFNTPASQPVAVNQANTTNQNTQLNSNQPINQAINQNINSNQNVNTDVSSSTDNLVNPLPVVNQNQNININITDQIPQAGPDQDGDKLSDAEESLYGTNPANSDTDGDGYSDGNELVNNYDPLKPQLSLDASGLFGAYQGNGYSLIYPTSWLVKKSGDDVIFQAGDGTFVQLVKINNADKLSVSNWFNQQFPNAGATVGSIKINNLYGLRSNDKLKYYLADLQTPDYIYFLSYNLSQAKQINFLTTFNVMLNSFKLATQ